MTKPAWWWLWAGYVNALPHTIKGFVFALIYGAGDFEWRDGVLTCVAGGDIWGTDGAQTHGWLTIYETEAQRQRADLRVHEADHVRWSMMLGLIYLIAYVVMFFAAWARHPLSGWAAAYRAIWFERRAFRIQAEFRAGKRPNAWGAL